MIQVLENNGDLAILRHTDLTVEDLSGREHIFTDDLGYLFFARRDDFSGISKEQFRAHYQLGLYNGTI